MPEQIKLSREVEKICHDWAREWGHKGNVSLRELARAIIAQVREEMKDGR